ncbi:5-formyltetrahydrofolate cyclo-ligase [Propionivibrio limicola]|uniref:5-formyltetrahydrofolate cyclo-ligase n=1 Tax=Propionivibrio limicola TaxID=167645 RepID=UPI001FEC355A|nr:5-formyltetrahydrofolate cyclo-ligase [Propionivibrio limicola]
MNAGPMPDAVPDCVPDRRALRQRLIERRLQLSPDESARLSTAVCAHLREHFSQLAGLRVGFCWPVKNEPDVRPLIEEWSAAGRPGFVALLPVVVDSGAALAFRAWTPQVPLIEDRYGIPTPVVGDFQTPQALLLPVNGFDAAGYRLGYGGGFFDMTLAALDPRPLAIGVGYELARVDSIRPEAHDMRLDAVVTEAGVFRTA